MDDPVNPQEAHSRAPAGALRVSQSGAAPNARPASGQAGIAAGAVGQGRDEPVPASPLALVLLATGNFVVGTSGFIVVSILPEITAGLGVSLAQGALLFTIYAGAYAIGSPLLISATGRIGRRRLLLAALAMVVASALVCALTRSFEVMLAARALAAFGGGLYTPVAASVVFATVPEPRRGRALGLVFAGLQLSQAAGLPLGVVIAHQLDWPAAFLTVAGLGMLSAAGLWWTLPRRVVVPVTSLRTLLDAGRDLRALAAVSIMALHACALILCYGLIAPLVMRHGGNVGLTVGAFGVGGVVAGLMMGRVTQRLGAVRARRIAIGSQLVILPVLSLPLIGIAPLPGALLIVQALLWHLLAGGMMIPQQILLMQRNPERGAVVLGLNATMNYLGFALGSALGGLVVAGLGYDWLGVAGGAVAGLALLLSVYSERLYRRAGQGL
ncbi:MFS transporter [Paracoccus sp. SJTW-4]|uniref:MFS transporter n=1 Tax=Paracoccus sp. SJTW-4 TaxID=3078428 RepID=UPI0039E80622